MNNLALTIFTYALLILMGGLMGHYKAASTASLVAGLLFGILLLGCALLVWKKQKIGAVIALVTTLVLDGFFTYRFCLTLKFMPPGLMSLISLGALFLMAYQMKRLKLLR